MDPGRSPCISITGHTDVTALIPGEAPPQTRLILPMEEVPFPKAGTYMFELRCGETTFEIAHLHLIANPDD
jgi:hypothetical protein